MRSTPSIPRRIIQTGRSHNLPPLPRAAVRTLQLLHPDWEYLFFDDDDVTHFIATEFPEHREIFATFPHRIQRFDLFRYLAVLRFGGFYFDLDVFLAEELDELRPQGCVFPFEELTLNRFLRQSCGIEWELGNYAFGAAAGDPFLAAVVENCVRAQRDRRWAAELLGGIPAPFRSRFEVLNTTGPGLVTRTFIEQATGAAAGVTVLFPENLADTAHWHRFGKFGVHLMEASWRERGNFVARKAALYWESWARRRFAAQSRAADADHGLALAKPA